MIRMSAAQALRSDTRSSAAGLGYASTDYQNQGFGTDEEEDYELPPAGSYEDEQPQFGEGMTNVPDEDSDAAGALIAWVPALIALASNDDDDDEPAGGSAYDTDGTLYADPIVLGDTLPMANTYNAGYAQGFADGAAGNAAWNTPPNAYADDSAVWKKGYAAGYAAGEANAPDGGGAGVPVVKTGGTTTTKTGGGTVVKKTTGGGATVDEEPNYLAYGAIGLGLAGLIGVAAYAYKKKRKPGRAKRRS